VFTGVSEALRVLMAFVRADARCENRKLVESPSEKAA